MLCASCKYPLPSSDAYTPQKTQSLLEFLRSAAVAADPSHYGSEIASVTPLLAQFDDEIRRAEETLESLHHNRNKIQEYIDGCRAAVAPVRLLPPEIWIQIFQSVAESYKWEDEWYNLVKPDLLQVAGVCSRWHDIVMGTPALWSNIHLDTYRWNEYGPGLQMLRMCFERTRATSLAMSVYLSDPLPGLLDLLEEHCHRWRSLTLRACPSDLELLHGVKGKLSTLETLSLDLYDDGTRYNRIIDIFEDAPNLKDVYIQIGDLGRIRHLPKLSWSRLQSFNLQEEGSEYIHLSAMEKLPPGAAFTLSQMRGNEYQDRPLSVSPITSQIATLGIEVADYAWTPARAIAFSQTFCAVLKRLTLPRLQTFWIRIPYYMPLLWRSDTDTDFGTHPFERLSASFSETLQCLDLSGVCITDKDLLRALTPLAALEMLEICDWPMLRYYRPEQEAPFVVVSDMLLRQLTRSQPFHMIPRLRRFICTSLFMFNSQVYYDFVASRIPLFDTTAPFENIMFRIRGVEDELVDGVVELLRPLTATQKLRLISPAGARGAEEPDS